MGTGRAFGANRPADGEPVLDRQHDVENDRVVLGNRRGVDRARTVGGHIDRVGLLAQALGEHVGGLGFVLDEEDPHVDPQV
jgi:hypothetical protein